MPCMVSFWLTLFNQPSMVGGKCRSISRFCPPPWQEFRGNCYLFVSEKLSYHDAEQHCQSYRQPGRPCHLASIHSDEENHFIDRLAPNKEVWMGYNDLAEEGTYGWLDGSPAGYDSWRPGFPVGDAYGNQDCILTLAGLWKEYFCGNRLKSVCKMARPN